MCKSMLSKKKIHLCWHLPFKKLKGKQQITEHNKWFLIWSC